MKNESYILLIQAGFIVDTENFGTIAPEKFDIGKDHFKPTFRDVFIGKTIDGHTYVTSHLYGRFRKYRSRYEHDSNILNIFASHVLEVEAVREFIRKFKKLEYNVVR